jgi:hypothetical protein
VRNSDDGEVKPEMGGEQRRMAESSRKEHQRWQNKAGECIGAEWRAMPTPETTPTIASFNSCNGLIQYLASLNLSILLIQKQNKLKPVFTKTKDDIFILLLELEMTKPRFKKQVENRLVSGKPTWAGLIGFIENSKNEEKNCNKKLLKTRTIKKNCGETKFTEIMSIARLKNFRRKDEKGR